MLDVYTGGNPRGISYGTTSENLASSCLISGGRVMPVFFSSNNTKHIVWASTGVTLNQSLNTKDTNGFSSLLAWLNSLEGSGVNLIFTPSFMKE